MASKIGVSALAGIHQTMFNADPREDIAVNAVHPGYVDTDMTSHTGPLTPDQGAIGPVYCALLPENTEIKGKYIWYDKTLAEWKWAYITDRLKWIVLIIPMMHNMDK